MQKVFEKIIDKLKEVGNLEISMYGGRCNGKTLTLGYKKGIENAIEIVKHESERYNNGWIPCSERLPENTSTVLVQIKEFESPTIGWYGNIAGWRLLEKDFDELNDFTVIAWQSLPPAYHPKGE